jgi:hypothetical protein
MTALIPFKQFICEFSERNQLKLAQESLVFLDEVENRFELLDLLYTCWSENGLVDDAEAGCSAGSFLRPVISNFLGLMEGNNWHIESIVYDVEQEDAEVVLQDKNNQQVKLSLSDFCGDWVPESVLETLQQFTHTHGEKTVAVFNREDSLYLMLPLAHDAYAQLQEETEKFLA